MIRRLLNFSLYSSIAILSLPCFLTVSCAEKDTHDAAPAEIDLSQASEIFKSPATAAPVLNATTIVAVVQGEDITQGDLNKEVDSMLNRMRSRVSPEQVAQMRPQVLQQAMDTLITKTLLRQAVETQKIEVSTEDVNEAVAKIEGSMGDGMTLDKFLEQTGMTQEQFRKELTLDLRINKLLEKNTDSVAAPSEEDLKKYYADNKEQFLKPETVTASHVLVAFEPEDDDKAKAAKKEKAEKIRVKLVDGEDFAKCASEDSDCPSKTRGGNLGSFRKGQMVAPFEDAAFSQKVDEIGPIVETRFGYHIIKVTEHETEREVPFDEVHDKLLQYLKSQKRQEAAQEFVKNLRASAQITYPEAAP